jgi:hypothetical protein
MWVVFSVHTVVSTCTKFENHLLFIYLHSF